MLAGRTLSGGTERAQVLQSVAECTAEKCC